MIKEKITNAKPTIWVTSGIPKWKVRWIVFTAKMRAVFVYSPIARMKIVYRAMRKILKM